MSSEEPENGELEDELPITKKAIVDSCMKHGFYIVPELNDVLYLQCKGYTKIADLEEYINVKTLWLNNNSLSSISCLSTLANLSTLYLQDNIIEKIEGLDELTSLETLILSSNYIEEITGLSHLSSLTTIELDHNQIRSIQSLEGLTCCPSLEIVNISHNKIIFEENEQQLFDILSKLQNLKVLKMDGNPFIRSISNYRRKIINILPQLRFLDDTPITENDRRLAAAWKSGGKNAEIQERYKINDENESQRKEGMRDFRRMKRDAVLSNENARIEDYPELLSSDDDTKEELMKKKYERLAQLEEMNEKKEPAQRKNELTFVTSVHNTQSNDIDDID